MPCPGPKKKKRIGDAILPSTYPIGSGALSVERAVRFDYYVLTKYYPVSRAFESNLVHADAPLPF